jgi:MFS superfamily sulfate permease-like transporter
VWRNIEQYPMASQQPHICVVRIDSPIYFANAEWALNRVQKYASAQHGDDKLGPVRFVILDMAPISYVDATGARPLTFPLQLLPFLST